MRAILYATTLLFFTLPASAQDEAPRHPHHPEKAYDFESELSIWCEQEARSRYIAKNITPYQWSSRYYNRDNVLYVEGKLRVHNEDVDVRCRVARGAREQYAVIDIDDPILQQPSQ
jgi:hypothetical protein